MPARDYTAALLDSNVRWRVSETTAEVIAIDAVSSGGNDAAGSARGVTG